MIWVDALLAGVTHHDAHSGAVDCQALLLQVLDELGLQPVTEAEARWELTRWVAAQILSGDIDPIAGASRIGYDLLFESFEYPDFEQQIGCAMVGYLSEAESYPAGRSAIADRIRHVAEIILGIAPNDIPPSIGRPVSWHEERDATIRMPKEGERQSR